jgi:hypothetical protein
VTTTTGKYESPDRATQIQWRLPEWSPFAYRLCGLGLHRLTRRLVVKAWMNYFTPVGHYYCACGRVRWMWFDGGWVSRDSGEPDGHRRWIEGQVEMQDMTR